MHRRTFLGRAATAVGSLPFATSVSAQSDADITADDTDDDTLPHYAAKPDAVELIYDEPMLQTFQPQLVTDHLDVEPTALYAWRATDTSDDPHPTDVLVYWASYSHQDGVSPFGGFLSDSHYGDHEPIYVEVNKLEESIERVHHSAYHWLRGWTTSPPTTDDGRPKMYVVNPWHQTRPAPEARPVDLTDVDLRDLTDRYRYWLKNGLKEDLRVGSVTNPWIMRDHESWWKPSSTFGLSINMRQYVANLSYSAGVAGADASEV